MNSEIVTTLITTLLLVIGFIVLFLIVGHFGVEFIDWLEKKFNERRRVD
jgi:hypothetical protein